MQGKRGVIQPPGPSGWATHVSARLPRWSAPGVQVSPSPGDSRVVARSLHQRLAFYVWSCIGCPLIGWSTAVFGTHGEGGFAKFFFLFIGLPVLLALVAARLLDRHIGDAVLGTVAAGALGALTWLLTILWLASQGVFE